MPKFISLLVLLSLMSASHASAKDGVKNENFEKRKARALQTIETKIGHFNTFKSCLSSATNIEALKACRTAHQKSMQAFRQDKKNRKAARKAAKNN